MCAGAIAWAQMGRLVFGAADEKRGYQRYAPQVLHPKTVVVKGVLEEECASLMKDFFKKRTYCHRKRQIYPAFSGGTYAGNYCDAMGRK